MKSVDLGSEMMADYQHILMLNGEDLIKDFLPMMCKSTSLDRTLSLHT